MKKSPRMFRCPCIKRVDKHDVKRQSIKGLIAATLIFVFVFGFAQSATAVTVTTRIVEKVTVGRNIAGVIIVRHESTTLWSFARGHLTDPRALTNDWWTAPLNHVISHSKRWDWYNTARHGSGRSNIWVRFGFGVPTPWGPIGTEMTSRHLRTVLWNGCWH